MNKNVKKYHFVFRYKCEDCEYQGKSKTHLRAHVQWAHKNKGHKCKLCDFTAMYQAGCIHDKNMFKEFINLGYFYRF